MLVEDKISFRKVSEIRPYARNPRRNEKTVELLCQLIPKVGFNVPLVVDEKGVIVKGHARYAAAIRLGMQELPCIVSHADPEAIKLDRITDNKISEFSEWVNEDVLKEIESINTDIDFSGLGFPVVDLSGAPQGLSDASRDVGGTSYRSETERGLEGRSEPQMKPQQKKKYYKCVCPDCGHVMFVEAGR